MGNFIIIAIGFILLVLVLRILFKLGKMIFYVVVLSIVGTVALHFFSPETIDNVIGKETHSKITNLVSNKIK